MTETIKPKRGERYVSRRGLGPDYVTRAVATVTAVRRGVVYFTGDGVGRSHTTVDQFAVTGIGSVLTPAECDALGVSPDSPGISPGREHIAARRTGKA